MGRLKQLLNYQGKPMVQHAVKQALGAGFAPIIVVTGSEGARVREAVAMLPVEIAENEHWQLGMGSSITSGMRLLMEIEPDAVAVAILLADQPLVATQHLCQMRALLDSDHAAIAAEYNGTAGVPAMFSSRLFPILTAVAPEAGAKHILLGLGNELQTFPLPQAAADIDTPEDYARISA